MARWGLKCRQIQTWLNCLFSFPHNLWLTDNCPILRCNVIEILHYTFRWQMSDSWTKHSYLDLFNESLQPFWMIITNETNSVLEFNSELNDPVGAVKIVNPKKIAEYVFTLRWGCFFIGTDLEKFSITSGEKYAQIKHSLQAKQSKIVLNKYVGGFWCEKTIGEGLFHWRKISYGSWTPYFG